MYKPTKHERHGKLHGPQNKDQTVFGPPILIHNIYLLNLHINKRQIIIQSRGRHRDPGQLSIPGQDRDYNRDHGQITEILRLVFFLKK